MSTKKNPEILNTLYENVAEYYKLQQEAKEITKRSDLLKIQNLALMENLDTTLIEFDDLGLKIEVVFPKKKVGVDVNALIELIGKERVEAMKIVPVEAVVDGIENKTVPEKAMDCIITHPGKEYTKVTKSKEPKSKEPKAAKEKITLNS
jgi:hypothetical protein